MLTSYGKIPRSNTQRVREASVAAPVGGWNARDALGDMSPLDAVTLTNFWPGTNSVILRKGHTQHVTGIGSQVETLMAYSSGSANKLFGIATDGKIYDVTTAGAVGAAVVSGLTNARFQYINFTTTAASYILCVNGADKQRIYDGSAWHTDGDGAPYDVTGLDTATCNNIVAFKNRVWLIKASTLKAYYLPINAIGGAATALDMSSLAQKGGYLVAGMTWTLDGGYGVDDYLAFITSNGEVLLWRLTDPTTPSGIALIGVFSVGAPVGKRCWLKYGGDLLILTQDGVVPMSKALLSSRTDAPISITDKIRKAVNDAVTLYGSNYGWQLFFFPKQNQLYLNVPVNTGDMQEQYVQNNITRAWCRFTGWEANCWELLSDTPYFGSDGFVGKAWTGSADNSTNINATALQSFQTYGAAVQKHCKMIRPHFLTDGSPSIYGNVNTDYDLSDNSAQLSASAVSYGVWDTAVWDVATWGSGLAPSANWEGATGIGYTFAPFLKVATQGLQLEWVATDLIFEGGGVL